MLTDSNERIRRNTSRCKSCITTVFPVFFFFFPRKYQLHGSCILPLVSIPIVSGLLMHYTVLYFVFCATSRTRVSNASGWEILTNVPKLFQSNFIGSGILLIYTLLRFIAMPGSRSFLKSALHFT